jgi:methylthioribose-1-phosphate isomerase
MKIDGVAWRPIWAAEDGETIKIIDQTKLPFAFGTKRLTTMDDAAEAISTMRVRGAPLIGVTAAYGLAMTLREDPSDAAMRAAYETLHATRPTAINLRWALDRVSAAMADIAPADRFTAAYGLAGAMADEDVEINRRIGAHGLPLLRDAAAKTGRVTVLTHCNAGWLATVDWGTATSPIYQAHDEGIDVHVWVDETRPRNQGAFLTAWELHQHGVSHSIVADNAGGHLMQRGDVDLCLVGTDRVTATGDVCNKIGTYLKALAAHDNGVPFYVCLPTPTIDWRVRDGVAEIPIENRAPDEVLCIDGVLSSGEIVRSRIASPGSDAVNPAFDVTPARLVTGLITEQGIMEASEHGLASLQST